MPRHYTARVLDSTRREHDLKPSDGKNDPESRRTTEDFRVASSPPAKKTKIHHENETATLVESRRAIANFLDICFLIG